MTSTQTHYPLPALLQSLWVPLVMPVPSTTMLALAASRTWATSSLTVPPQGSLPLLGEAARWVPGAHGCLSQCIDSKGAIGAQEGWRPPVLATFRPEWVHIPHASKDGRADKWMDGWMDESCMFQSWCFTYQVAQGLSTKFSAERVSACLLSSADCLW
jgi:hypothetical protein